MGLSKEAGAKPDIDAFLRRRGTYPLSHAGDKTRIHVAYSGEGWGLNSALTSMLLQDKELQETVETNRGRGMNAFKTALRDAVIERGRRGYAEEWKSLTQEQVDEVVNAAAALPNFANETNAAKSVEIIRRELNDWSVAKDGFYNIADLGSAAGNTSIEILRLLSPDEKAKVRFVALDTMKKGLIRYRERFEEEGLEENQVMTVTANFHKMSDSKQLKDVVFHHVVSGAALHHDPNPVEVFKMIFKKMAPGAYLNTWDWCHPAWRAENLVVAPKNAVVSPDGRAYHLGRKTVEAGEKHAFISQDRILGVSGNAPSEVQAVREILAYWPGLLRIPNVKETFIKDLDKALREGTPFNYHAYVHKWVGETPRNPKTGEVEEGSNWYLEAHPHPKTRIQDLTAAGFRKIDARLILPKGLKIKSKSLSPNSLLTHFLFQKPNVALR